MRQYKVKTHLHECTGCFKNKSQTGRRFLKQQKNKGYRAQYKRQIQREIRE